jgi:hypothetical protein
MEMEMGIGGRFCIPSLGLNKAGGKPTKTGFGSTDFVNQISVASGAPGQVADDSFTRVEVTK